MYSIYKMSIESVTEAIIYELKQTFQSEKDSLRRLRINLEPYIFNYLSTTYYQTLQEHWNTYTPPLNSKYAYAFIERRCHPNIDFLLKNIAWANPTMSIYIFCSDLNENYIRALLGDKISNITIIQAFTGEASPQEGYKEFNKLLANIEYYECFDKEVEYIMTVQTDAFIRRKITEDMFIGDYWGAPWKWDHESAGGGGVTIRKVSSMKEICKKYTYEFDENVLEDNWFCDKVKKLGLAYPDVDFRAMRIMESVYVTNPVAIHQFWTFAYELKDNSYDEVVSYIKQILTFDI
jgi:hypothetical protein